MLNSIKRVFVLGFAFALLLPFTASAHVKWFVADDLVSTRAYSFFDLPVILWMIISLLIISIGILFEKNLPSPRRLSFSFFSYIDPVIITIFSIFIGIGLVIFSFQGLIFAPTLVADSSFEYTLIVVQTIIGISFILGTFVQLSAILLALLYGVALWHFGFWQLIDHLEILGIALMLFLSIRPYWTVLDVGRLLKLGETYRVYAIPLLRVFTGLNLIVLGFTEKILYPELGITFLRDHPWNFMQMIGFEAYTGYWFVLSAGAVEVLLGVIFVLGIVTRLNALVVLAFFIITLVLLGPVEVIGHILHFAILLILLVFGSATKLKLVRGNKENKE